MRMIGMLGGMSWESTSLYYRRLNEGVRTRLGGLHSARILLESVDFAEIEALQRADQWRGAGDRLAGSARRLEAGGADFLLLCTNTMHRVAPAIEAAIGIPLLHLADATARRLVAAGVKRVGLLGTRFTMEQDFYRERLAAAGLDVTVPPAHERARVHRIIFDELCIGTVNPDSRTRMLGIMDGLHAAGAEAVILGCTELTLLVDERHTDIPLFDTTAIHAEAAVDAALAGTGGAADAC